MARLRLRRSAADTLDQDWLDECADMGKDRCNRYALYEAYYDGEHKTELTDRMRRYLEASGLKFCENFCEPVVDVMAERMRVTGFIAEDGKATKRKPGEERPPVEQWLDMLWQRQLLDATQGQVHAGVVKCGEEFVIVDWDPAKMLPRVTVQRRDQVKVVYRDDRPDEVEYASKRWNTSQAGPSNPEGRAVTRLNVYWPDMVEKYFRAHKSDGHGGWERWIEPTGEGQPPEPWPLPWKDGTGLPRGVPVFHFRHRPNGDTGRSELRNVIPQQDALNKLLIDLHDISDAMAWPQRWASGVTNDNASLIMKPGELLTTQSADAKFGQFEAADLTRILSTIESQISRIARRSRTPLHLLVGGDVPSGEALKSAEAGLVAKIKSAQTPLGDTWERVAAFALALAADHGQGAPPFDPTASVLETQWHSPESRNEVVEAERASKLHDLGVSRYTLLSELGYDPEFEMEQRQRERDTLDEAAGRLLDAGAAGLPGGRAGGTVVA